MVFASRAPGVQGPRNLPEKRFLLFKYPPMQVPGTGFDSTYPPSRRPMKEPDVATREVARTGSLNARPAAQAARSPVPDADGRPDSSETAGTGGRAAHFSSKSLNIRELPFLVCYSGQVCL